MNNGAAEVVVDLAAFGKNLQGHLKMRNGFVDLSLFQEKHSEIGMRNFIVRGDSERMRPKRLAVLPVRRLFPGAGAERRENDRRCSSRGRGPISKRGEKIGDQPGKREVQTDLR